jgi:hypothetical protein
MLGGMDFKQETDVENLGSASNVYSQPKIK